MKFNSPFLFTVLVASGAAVAAVMPQTVRAQGAKSVLDGIYAPAQAASGRELYPNTCAGCHGAALGGASGPALIGGPFIERWQGKTVGDLFEKIKTTMPAGAPGTLSADATADLVSFILGSNGFTAGTTRLALDAAPLKAVKMAAPPGGVVAVANLAPPARPPLFFKEEWKQRPANDEHPLSQASVGNPNLELKVYGSAAKEGLLITGTADNPQNPTHVWNGMCTSNCALTLRDKRNFVDLTGQAKFRWLTKVNGFQKIHPIVTLADGTMLVGDWADGSTVDWRESEAYFSEIRWIKLDPTRVVTTGPVVEKPDLSKVDAFGWTDLMAASGHGMGGWSDVGTIEVYGKPVPR
jgi:mono/diheme cytochrome c family protein